MQLLLLIPLYIPDLVAWEVGGRLLYATERALSQNASGAPSHIAEQLPRISKKNATYVTGPAAVAALNADHALQMPEVPFLLVLVANSA